MNTLLQKEFGSSVTYRRLGGPIVPFEVLVAEVGQLPLDGVLGFLGILSLEAVKSGQAFFHPTVQGHYLNLAIVDDFPQPLPAAPKMYAPGRVPITDGEHLFIHEQNIAFLSHIAILFSKVTSSPSPIGYELMRRICRLLLIVNDFLNSEHRALPRTLTELRNFAIRWIRNGQFNRFYKSLLETMITLARQRILMLGILPKYYPNLLTSFVQATNGVSLQKYFEILALLLSHVYKEMGPDKHWLRKETFGAALKAGRDELELILTRWIVTPSQYREVYESWTGSNSESGGYLAGFDFVPLRATPLIEARPGELICAALPFLLAKIEDDPYFILSDYLQDSSQFQSALGESYHEYANSLLSRVSRADIRGSWTLEHP